MEPVPLTPPPLAAKRQSVVRVSSGSVPKAKGTSAKLRSQTLAERVRLLATTDGMWIMYLQSVLVWNIPSHLAALFMALYLLVSFGEAWVVRRLSFFQVVGLGLVAWGCLSMWLARRARHAAKRAQQPSPPAEPKERLERGLFWPQDAAGASAESFPLGLRLFTARVKLLSLEELLELWVEGSESLRRALYALRILRYSNPTQFALNICFVCFVGAVVGSYFSGKTLLLAALFALLLGPGLARRQVWGKLRRRLEARLGRGWVEWLLVSTYLNLEETNTAKVVAFVRSADGDGPGKPKVVSKPIA